MSTPNEVLYAKRINAVNRIPPGSFEPARGLQFSCTNGNGNERNPLTPRKGKADTVKHMWYGNTLSSLVSVERPKSAVFSCSFSCTRYAWRTVCYVSQRVP